MNKKEISQGQFFSLSPEGAVIDDFFGNFSNKESLLEIIQQRIGRLTPQEQEGVVFLKLFRSKDPALRIIEEGKVVEKEQLPDKLKSREVLIFIDHFIDDPSSLGTLDEIIKKLGFNTQILIVEFSEKRGVMAEEKEVRKETLRALGLVGVKIKSKDGFLLLSARTCKERKKKREGVNLTVKPWFQKLMERRIRDFKEAGWEKVDPQEILKKCANSFFPPKDWQDVVLGFGFELTAPCGCRWRVDTHGSWHRLNKCSEECEGVPYPKNPKERGGKRKEERIFYIGSNIPVKDAIGKEMRCRKCGSPLLVDRRLDKDGIAISDLKCPHCGLKSSKKLRVPKEAKIEEIKEKT